VREFFESFPSDDACLDHIMDVRYGKRHPCDKCLNLATFHRLANRHAYSCARCGHHVYPAAGTTFQDSRTSL
jgi:transposase